MDRIKILKIIFHITIPLLFIFAVLGISFGVIYPNNRDRSNQIQTLCQVNETVIDHYDCCEKICNSTLPSCESLLNSSLTGECCDVCPIVCRIVCNNCTRMNVTYEYQANGQELLYNTTVNCQNNTCQEQNSTNCWYEKSNIYQVSFTAIPMFHWAYIYAIIVLSILPFVYIGAVIIIHREYPSVCL